jgi:hypothetical protein
LPVSLEAGLDFFFLTKSTWPRSPQPEMRCVVTSDYTGDMLKCIAGMIITYKISPLLLGIKLNWMTEITHVEEGTSTL